jgi:hypothetical protein
MVKIPPDSAEKYLTTFSVSLFAGVATIKLNSVTRRKRLF